MPTIQTAPPAVYGEVITALLDNRAQTATKILAANHVVRASRRLIKGRIPPAREGFDFVVTEGRPNYRTRLLIKQMKKAGEPFPVKKVQLKFPPKPVVKAKRGTR